MSYQQYLRDTIHSPLSAFHGNAAQKPESSAATAESSATVVANVASSSSLSSSSSKQVPIGPQPALIPTTGIRIYDEIGQAMIGNPLNPPDPVLVTKLSYIGIGHGKTPSSQPGMIPCCSYTDRTRCQLCTRRTLSCHIYS